jgi:hypothetical protein
MWHSVFLHEFLDHRLDNFQALPGRLTPASFQLAPMPDTGTGANSILIRPGLAFDFRLTTPLADIIGISCRVRMRYAVRQPDYSFAVASLGSGASLLLKTESNPTDVGATLTSPAISINQSFSPLKLVNLPDSYVDFRFDWHTSGQARIVQNGQLVAYRHSVAPGAVLTVDRVVVGLPDAPPSPVVEFRISRIFVRVLSRTDALSIFSRLLPKLGDVTAGDPKKCRQAAIDGVLAMADKLRQFMGLVHTTLTQSWSAQAGPAQGPFQAESMKAHALATKAGAELVAMLRSNDYSSPNRFLIPFVRFLRILRDARPAEFQALAAELLKTTVVPDDCKDSLAKQDLSALQPLIDLLQAASYQIQRLAGGK